MPAHVALNPAASAGTPAANRTPTVGALTPTAPFQESPRVSADLVRLARACKRGVASQTYFRPAVGTRFEAKTFNYHTGICKKMSILQAPADGVVRGTIVMNPSGHTGQVHRFAQSNTYAVRVKLPNGKVLTKSGIPRNDPSKAEYATSIPIEFPYMKGTTVVEAYPDGSARAGGYIEGRRYEIRSADQPWDFAQFRKRADEAKQRHEQVAAQARARGQKPPKFISLQPFSDS